MNALLRSLLAGLTCSLALTALPSKAQNIVQASEATAALQEKMRSVIVVGTSGRHPDQALGNKQALITAEVRKLLKTAGVQVFPIAIKLEDSDPASVVDQGVAQYGASHLLNMVIPSGTVVVKRSTGESVSAKAYAVEAEVQDAKSRAVVWRSTLQVEVGFFLGKSNADVAAAIVDRMRADGLL